MARVLQWTAALAALLAVPALAQAVAAEERRGPDVRMVERERPVRALDATGIASVPAGATIGSAIPGRYIVTVNPTVRPAVLARAVGAAPVALYTHAIKGFVAKLTSQQAADLASDPSVIRVEPDRVVGIDTAQVGAGWGLDRIDQRFLPLDNTYTYDTTGAGVNVYIIDTGILATHQEFAGRVRTGYTAIADGNGTSDCHGHGTHVSGTVGGTNYGVAKAVTLKPVRVLSCAGLGSASDVILGIDWVVADHAAGTPAVANMSLGGGFSSTLNDAVRRGVADGVTFVVAAGNKTAGNESMDACTQSPAGEPQAVTVGATTSGDSRASFSNFGSCLDIFAPGEGILSSWFTSSTAEATLSGTSMASPHVAGAAALLLQSTPTASPATIAARLQANATPDRVTDPGFGSVNLLLNTNLNLGPTGVSNDAFVDAIVISGASGSVTGSTTTATREVGEPTHGGSGGSASIWYRWTAPANGTLGLSTNGSGFDTLLGAYTGSSVGSLTTRGQNDDAPGGQWSAVSIPVTSGTQYALAIDGHGGGRGATVVTWNFAETPPAAPAAPSAVAGDASATVTVTPASSGGVATSHTITASPGGATCTVAGAAGSCLASGLANGTAYTFTATASNAGGTAAASAASGAVTPTANNAFTMANATAKATKKAVILTTRVTVPGAGRIAQRATTKAGRKTTTLCAATTSTTKAATYTLTCTMGSAARAALRRSGMRVSLRTTFTPTAGTRATRTQTIRIARNPVRALTGR